MSEICLQSCEFELSKFNSPLLRVHCGHHDFLRDFLFFEAASTPQQPVGSTFLVIPHKLPISYLGRLDDYDRHSIHLHQRVIDYNYHYENYQCLRISGGRGGWLSGNFHVIGKFYIVYPLVDSSVHIIILSHHTARSKINRILSSRIRLGSESSSASRCGEANWHRMRRYHVISGSPASNSVW